MRFILKTGLAMLLLLSCEHALGKDPNVLLFTIDSCRADRFGLYGGRADTTPSIDRWSRLGTVFTNAYSTSAWTAPGLVSILTGLHPPAHGINNRDRMGSPELVTLPKIMRDRGYSVPNLNFFTFAPYYRNLGLGRVERRYFGKSEGEELLNWLGEYSSEKPFFLWYHTTMVHQPYDPGDTRLPAPRRELHKSPGIKAAMTGAIVPRGSAVFRQEDRPVLERLYDAELSRVDRLFQQMLDLLEKGGHLADTLIILTADHGEELLDHGFVGHASTSLYAQLYEEFIRIPLVVVWPGHVPVGSRADLVNQPDILPSALRLSMIDPPPGIEGRDLFADHVETRPLFFESVIAGNQTSKEQETVWVRAVREGNVKYITRQSDFGGGELYRLDIDPGEERDRAEDEPDLARRLARQLAARFGQWSQDPPDNQHHSSSQEGKCPVIYTPEDSAQLTYETYTGSLLFDWRGDLQSRYLIEYDIGTGTHHVEGVYEVDGNHQVLGPFPKELWGNLKAWNPFKIRVSPKTEPRCWSEWIEFGF